MDVISIVRLLGGLGLFLFGMTLMSDSLERLAGERLEQTLASVTQNPIKGVLFGAAVTAVIQSSSATTVMVVGFVNAGIMSLMQAAGVIMGANIGTTITAQILKLDTTGTVSGNTYFMLLKPSNMAYIAVAFGMILIFAKIKKHDLGKIFIGFGILFIGMGTMETALSGLTQNPAFTRLFVSFKNPLIGLAIGIAVTAVIQSSSASIGILQALSGTGIVTWSAAIPIILGQNIGSCVTALLASVGAKKNARRAAFIHVLFNVVGTAVFMILFYTAGSVVKFDFMNMPADKSGIANFHTMFNLCATVLFLPVIRFFVFLAEKLVKSDKNEDKEIFVLDPMLYETPAVALDKCHDEITEMGIRALENLRIASKFVLEGAPFDRDRFFENENFLDLAEVKIGQYMLGIKQSKLSAKARRAYNEMIWSVCEFERIGDYAENIFNQGERMTAHECAFSPDAAEVLRGLCRAADEILAKTVETYRDFDIASAKMIEPMNQAMDFMKSAAENKFINRLNNGDHKFNAGIIFMDIAHICLKISEHCSVLAVNMIEAYERHEQFDRHKYLKQLQRDPTAEYSECYDNFIGRHMKTSEA